MSHLSEKLAPLRTEYMRAGLKEEDVAPDPLVQFEAWMGEAIAAGVQEANAMTLATASPDGIPHARIVLLKGVDARGFTFFTNEESAKGTQMAANPQAALVIFWGELQRQVRVEGTVAPIARAESEVYFASRPRGSQLGAWASPQSAPVDSRASLDARLAEIEARFASAAAVPCPPRWGGYRVTPRLIELWQGRENRLRYVREIHEGATWRIERLAP